MSSFNLNAIGGLSQFLTDRGSDTPYLLLRESPNKGNFYMSIPSRYDRSLKWMPDRIREILELGGSYSPEEFVCGDITLVIKKSPESFKYRDVYCEELYDAIFSHLSTSAIAGTLAKDTRFQATPAIACAGSFFFPDCEVYESLYSIARLSQDMRDRIGKLTQFLCSGVSESGKKLHAVVFVSPDSGFFTICQATLSYLGWRS